MSRGGDVVVTGRIFFTKTAATIPNGVLLLTDGVLGPYSRYLDDNGLFAYSGLLKPAMMGDAGRHPQEAVAARCDALVKIW